MFKDPVCGKHINRNKAHIVVEYNCIAYFLCCPLCQTEFERSPEKYAHFTPSRLHVNQGDRVIITLTTSDVVHGFYLDGYGLKTRVEPGVSQRIEFVADRPGNDLAKHSAREKTIAKTIWD